MARVLTEGIRTESHGKIGKKKSQLKIYLLGSEADGCSGEVTVNLWRLFKIVAVFSFVLLWLSETGAGTGCFGRCCYFCKLFL